MKTTLNPFENAKRTANGTGGGVSPSVIEEIQAEISVLGSQNETQAQDIIDIKGSLNSINDNLSKTMVKLWENTSPSSNFVAQDIPLDLSNYRMIKIICNHSKVTSIRSISADVMVGDSMYLTKVMPESTTLKMYCMQRTVVTSSSQVSFGDCLFATTTSAATTSNDRMIPYQIYGVI